MNITITKQFAVVSYKIAQLENYDYKVEQEFDNEDDALAAAETLSESDNAVQGCTVVYKNKSGEVVEYA